MSYSLYKATVTGGSLKLRAKPEGTQIAIIPNNYQLVVMGDGSAWVQTIYGMNEGWVMKEYLTNNGSAEYWQYLYGLKNLYNGCSQSLFVKNLQEILIKSGYLDGTADGIFGAKTEAAVKAYQRAEGLTVDGIAGDATKRSLTPEAP